MIFVFTNIKEHGIMWVPIFFLIVLIVSVTVMVSSFCDDESSTKPRETWVSLTTIPERLRTKYFRQTIANILSQNPTKILLNLPYVYRRTGEPYVVPDWVLAEPKIQVIRCLDSGPSTKILGSLSKLPDDSNVMVVVIDDDLKYRDFFLTEMKRRFLPDNIVSCFHIWKDHIWFNRGHDFYMPGGFSGCAASSTTWKKLQDVPQPEDCRLIDDHWLGWAYHQKGISMRFVNEDKRSEWRYSIDVRHPHPAWHELGKTTNRKIQAKKCIEALEYLSSPKSGLQSDKAASNRITKQKRVRFLQNKSQ